MSTALVESPKPLSLFHVPGCRFSEVGLEIDSGMKFEHWERLLRSLERAEQGIQWYIGDALNYGEQEYGEKYAQVMDAHKKTGIPVDTLRNYQWVAGAVKPVTRVTTVDWSIHREVAPLSEDKQREILQKAAGEKAAGRKYTRRNAERDVATAKRDGKPAPDDSERVLSNEAREFLDDYMADLARWSDRIPATLSDTERGTLQVMIHEQGADALRLRNRTRQSDCAIIVKVMRDTEAASHDGEMAAADLYVWVENLRYFMSKSEFQERLEYMTLDTVRMALLTDAGEDGKQEERRGKLPGIVCVPWRKVWKRPEKKQRDEDDED